MFPYFGRKARIAGKYPRPVHDLIVEPFAGSAGYAGYSDYWTRDVLLVELDDKIAGLWLWLIEDADRAAIMGLPDMVKGARLSDFVDGPQLTLMQLVAPTANRAQSVTEWMARDWPGIRSRLAGDVHKVKHWLVVHGDYTAATVHCDATWFVDPPYQKIGHGYGDTRQSLDFTDLGEWCRTRPGQVIVCEESGADWLPFAPLTAQKTLNNTDTVEVMWTNGNTSTLF